MEILDKIQLNSDTGYLLPDTFLNCVYPVGSIYWSYSDTFNPNTTFGGTWVKIEGKTIISSGTITDDLGNSATFSTGATGGATYINLSIENMPSHTHYINHTHEIKGTTAETSFEGSVDIMVQNAETNGTFTTTTENFSDGKSGETRSQQGTLYFNGNHTHSIDFWSGASSISYTESVGKSSPINILPPYEVAYCWKRTA